MGSPSFPPRNVSLLRTWFLYLSLTIYMLLLLWKTTTVGTVNPFQLEKFYLLMCLLTQRLYLCLYLSYIVKCQEIPFGLLMVASTLLYPLLQKSTCLLPGVVLAVPMRRQAPLGALLHLWRSPVLGLWVFVYVVVSEVGMGNIVFLGFWRYPSLQGGQIECYPGKQEKRKGSESLHFEILKW